MKLRRLEERQKRQALYKLDNEQGFEDEEDEEEELTESEEDESEVHSMCFFESLIIMKGKRNSTGRHCS